MNQIFTLNILLTIGWVMILESLIKLDVFTRCSIPMLFTTQYDHLRTGIFYFSQEYIFFVKQSVILAINAVSNKKYYPSDC